MDVTLRQPILSANFYMGRLPDSHAGRYFAARDAGAEFFGEEHVDGYPCAYLTGS